MQGLITLDFGNTHPHAGFFQKTAGSWNLLKVVPLAELALYANQLEITPENTAIVLSEVKVRQDEVSSLQEKGFLVTRLKDYWRGQKFAGMPVHYAHTLGEDRLIEAYYAYKKIKAPVLIIDAGTYTTMDVVTSEGFQGGYIIPGVDIFQATFQSGEKLKDVSFEEQFVLDLPKTTAQAMKESYTAFASLARELIKTHQLEKVILTGGKTELWKKFLSSSQISAVIEPDPHFIHKALQFWFTTQVEPL